MNLLFIETSLFTRQVGQYLTPDDYRGLQLKILSDPRAGVVIPDSGGVRKMRFRVPSKGKGSRSGLRIIYVYVEVAEWVLLLTLYAKGEKEDISHDESKKLAKLVRELKQLALKKSRRD